jgi:hypothetical protein
MATTVHQVGWNADARRVIVEIAVETRDAGSRITIVGGTVDRTGCDFESYGMSPEHVAGAVCVAPGWTVADVASLLDIWERWRLHGRDWLEQPPPDVLDELTRLQSLPAGAIPGWVESL